MFPGACLLDCEASSKAAGVPLCNAPARGANLFYAAGKNISKNFVFS
jgi:hypothetical protein